MGYHAMRWLRTDIEHRREKKMRGDQRTAKFIMAESRTAPSQLVLLDCSLRPAESRKSLTAGILAVTWCTRKTPFLFVVVGVRSG